MNTDKKYQIMELLDKLDDWGLTMVLTFIKSILR